MTPDRTRWCELLVGLERVEVLDALREGGRLVVTVESSASWAVRPVEPERGWTEEPTERDGAPSAC